jgi:hypothetical protein
MRYVRQTSEEGRVQITRFSVHQTAKVIGLAYFRVTLVFIPLFLTFVFSESGSMKWFFLFAPLIYGVMAYLFSAFACVIYNLLARRVGGIEFETSSNPTATDIQPSIPI